MKTPKAPDPYQTAAAQQSAEIGAAGASSVMNNPNVITPYGSQSYKISSWESVPDANGKMIKVPRYTQTQSLSPDQMKLMGLSTQTEWNLGKAATEQSSKVGKYLNQGIDSSKWQPWSAGPNAPTMQGQFANVGGPQRQVAGGGPIQSQVGNAGNVATSFQGGGNIQNGFGSAGSVQRGYATGGPVQKQIGATANQVQGKIANQNVRQDSGPTDRKAIEKAMMQNYTMDTQGQNAAQDAQMAARGLSPGSSQYGGMDQTRQNARGRAVNEAYLASGNESRAAQDAYNQAANQRFSQGAQIGQFANQAQQQQFDQAAQRAGFANAAQQQAYQQNQQLAQFGNQAQQQTYDQLAGRAAFSNQAQQQRFGQNQAQAQFGNEAQQQVFAQLAQRLGLSNAAQLQQFNQNQTQGQFANSAQQQAYQQAMQRVAFGNEAMGQNFAMGGQAADRGNALRGMQGQEAFALRNQPINEITALLGGSQVTAPQFSPYQGQGINAPNLAGMIGQNYQSQLAASQAQNSGIAGLGSAAITGLFGLSERSMKQDISHVPGSLAGLPLYEFSYRHDPFAVRHIGVMADEARLMHPDAVVQFGGVDHVNYGLLLARHGGQNG